MARDGGRSSTRMGKKPFPTRQMAILALCRISEPIAFMSIFPYIYHMVASFGVAQSKAEISVYAGMVTSAFAFAECVSSVFWGRLSDRVGRKKVLLGGLFGTGVSMLLFGFARSLPLALIARALGGLLNGNIGVLQTTVAELVTVKEQKPFAFSIMPFVWCLGTIIGSSLGGMLARPVETWPSVFGGTLFETYPYLLPNLVCTFVVLCGLAIGILFLEETHEDVKYDRDYGREIGSWILRKVQGEKGYVLLSEKDESFDEMRGMLEDGSRAYDSTTSSPTLCSTRSSMTGVPEYSLEKVRPAKLTMRQLFSKQICLIIISVGTLAFHTISLEQLLPILMEAPESNEAPQLPFKFHGGFAFSIQTVGSILAVQGILQMIVQIFVFPWVNTRIGSLRTFWLAMATYPFLYLLAPYLALLPEQLRIPGIFLLLVWKVTAQSISYPSLNLLLNGAAPSSKVLGTLNGTFAASASLCRGFGPTISGAIATAGEHIGVSGLAWWVCAGIALLAWIPGFTMEKEEGTKQDEETGCSEALVDHDSDTDSVSTISPYGTVEVSPPSLQK